MMLIEQTQVPDAALPVAEFRDHLQLGSGFADDGLQDAVLLPQLRAAMAAVETETGKALFERRFQHVVTAWRNLGRQVLPVAPVAALVSLTITDLTGGEEVIDAGAYSLRVDAHAPALCSAGWSLPVIPVGGTAEIVLDAGFGPSWGDIPVELRQAVLMLATHYYENRSAVSDREYAMPMGVKELCRRHKPVRLFGGGRR